MLRQVLIALLAQVAASDTARPGTAEHGETIPESLGAPRADESVSSDIVVTGRIPRCRARAGDPLDDVDLSPAAAEPRQQVVRRDPETGIMGVVADDDPVTGPGVWQRAGTRMDQYVFRVPDDGSPLCIGARSKAVPGWGQLRQVVDATPYRGKIVRLTLWAASRDTGRVWFWIASGRVGTPNASRGADMATESGSFEFRGTRRWTPVSLIMGPVRCDQEKLSFGALLDGAGDLWIYRPELEVIGEQSEREAQRDCSSIERRRRPS